MTPSNSTSSYAEMVREDTENIPGQSCDMFYFQSTGLEVDPLRAICECALQKLKIGGINNADRNTLLKLFSGYKDSHPEDTEAQYIKSDDIEAIAKFILGYDSAHSGFMNLMSQNPDDEHLIDIENKGIYAIVQFMRSRTQAVVSQ